jgi:redox-sensing transcriptional repressor
VEKTIGRMSLYRRLLLDIEKRGASHVYSHELARVAGIGAAQVRRDLMTMGFSGSPSKGYHVADLIGHIGTAIDPPEQQRVALVGVGNLGRAILAYFHGRRPKLAIVAAFDDDSAKVDKVVHGCRCHPLRAMSEIVPALDITVGIITVPAESAQDIADRLVNLDIKGILNFAPAALRVPPGVFVDTMDITTALEKVAYFARKGR